MPGQETSDVVDSGDVAFVSNRRNGASVQQEIKRLMLSLALRPGDAMPTEGELVELLGVSRGSVREALKGLQALEIVEVRHGTGTFVANISLGALVDGLTFHGLLEGRREDLSTARDLADVRAVLEGALIQRVAVDIDDDGLARLEAIVQRMEAAGELGAVYHQADRDFHVELYSGLHNNLVLLLLDAFWQVLDGLRGSLPKDQLTATRGADHHRRVLDQLRDHNPEGARKAMEEHFIGIFNVIVNSR